MANVCPICNNPLRQYGKDFYVCEVCETYFDKDENIVLTEQAWLRTATTEQLADFLFGIAYMCSYCGDESHSTKEKTQQCHFGKCCCQRKDWVEWLKQPHTKE